MTPSDPSQISLDHLVSLARLGAAKAGRLTPDPDEFNEVAAFVGEQLEARRQEPLSELETRLRQEDRRALAWYLTIVRTLSGTVQLGQQFRHLLFIPVRVEGPGALRLPLEDTMEEVAGGLEHALDLGHGTLRLSSTVIRFSTLELMSPLEWHAIVCGERDLIPSEAPVEELGAVVGRWDVPAEDRMRLSRKLTHALQRSPTLNAWKARTEGLLEEKTPGIRARIFPVVLLQDLFMLMRQVCLSTQLERAARECKTVRHLSWCWSEKTGELSWRLVCEGRNPVTGSAGFPDEPAELVEAQLRRLAQRLQLELSPPLL